MIDFAGKLALKIIVGGTVSLIGAILTEKHAKDHGDIFFGGWLSGSIAMALIDF